MLFSRSPIGRTNQRRHYWLRGVVLALAAWFVLAWGAARALIVNAELKHADALVILAGSSTYEERARHAAQLFHAGRAPLILLTNDGEQGGWSSEQQRNPYFVELAAAALQSADVPTGNIKVLPQRLENTHEEASAVRVYATAQGWHSILVVTSAYHSRRALWTWQSVFQGSPIVIGMDSPPPTRGTFTAATWWWHSSGWRLVAGEYLKLIYYWWKYK